MNEADFPLVPIGMTSAGTPAAADVRFAISKPLLGPRELDNVTQCIASGWISSRGSFVDEFERICATYCVRRYAAATSTGTAALHLALLALGVGPGDAVIVPDLTFAATINAVLHCGATPVIAPVSSEDWNIDVERLPEFITSETKAVIAVHLYGRPCKMGALMAVTQRHGLALVEDCAQAHGARTEGRPVGSFGDIACFSFFGNKIVTTGEGGLCLTDDPQLDDRIRLFRDHGRAPSAQYWHSVIGYNYRMTNLQAAVGCAQMERIDEFLFARDELHRLYECALGGHPSITTRPSYSKGRQVCWLETVLVDTPDIDGLIRSLKARGVDARRAFTPLSRMPVYACYARGHDPVADSIWRQGLSLPTYVGLEWDGIQEICSSLFDCLFSTRRHRSTGGMSP